MTKPIRRPTSEVELVAFLSCVKFPEAPESEVDEAARSRERKRHHASLPDNFIPTAVPSVGSERAMSAFLPGARAAALSVSRSAMRVECARAFSVTAGRHSKLGRTPISLPPGVELKVGERWVQKDLTSYLEKGRRTVTVEGPLGMSFPPFHPFRSQAAFPGFEAGSSLGRGRLIRPCLGVVLNEG